MNTNTICDIAIAAGSFLLGGSLGLALSGGCDICGKKDDSDWVEFEEDVVEETTDSLIAINNDIYDKYEKKASKYYIQETFEGDLDGEYVEPYIVSRDSYENEYQDFHKESLVYFDVDRVLVDDHDDVIEEVEKIVGSEALVSFGEGSEDEDIVYVRNMRIQCDFEIVREHMSYKENVLGIREDSKEYLEAKKFFNLEE